MIRLFGYCSLRSQHGTAGVGVTGYKQAMGNGSKLIHIAKYET